MDTEKLNEEIEKEIAKKKELGKVAIIGCCDFPAIPTSVMCNPNHQNEIKVIEVRREEPLIYHNAHPAKPVPLKLKKVCKGPHNYTLQKNRYWVCDCGQVLQ